MTEESPLISAEDVARAFGVSKKTVLRWAESGRIASAGRLPGHSGAVIFDRAYIEQVVAEREQAAGEQAAS